MESVELVDDLEAAEAVCGCTFLMTEEPSEFLSSIFSPTETDWLDVEAALPYKSVSSS